MRISAGYLFKQNKAFFFPVFVLRMSECFQKPNTFLMKLIRLGNITVYEPVYHADTDTANCCLSSVKYRPIGHLPVQQCQELALVVET